MSGFNPAQQGWSTGSIHMRSCERRSKWEKNKETKKEAERQQEKEMIL